MSDQPSRAPPTWGEWKERHQRWAWVLSPEWATECMVHWSRDWDLVNALHLAGKFGIVVAVFFAEADDRQKAKHYRAWDLINSARGSTGMADAALRSRTSTRTRRPWPQLPCPRRICSKCSCPQHNGKRQIWPEPFCPKPTCQRPPSSRRTWPRLT